MPYSVEASASTTRPPVLRARHGPERFALDCLSEADRELALNDAALWFRQLWLFSLAQGARKEKVRFLKEHPQDPQEYKAKSDSTDYPSFFAWPEWASFKKKFDIKEVKLDLGGLGHERRKPTTLGTNIGWPFGGECGGEERDEHPPGAEGQGDRPHGLSPSS